MYVKNSILLVIIRVCKLSKCKELKDNKVIISN